MAKLIQTRLKVKTAINTSIPKQAMSSLRITATGKKKATSKALKGTKVLKVFKVNVVKTEPKVYQAATDEMAHKDQQDEMAATEKMS